MARPCICPFCKMPVKKEDAFEYKKKHYHVDCFGAMSRQTTKIEQSRRKQKVEKAKENIKKQTPVESQEEISDEEILAKDKLLDYLKQLFGVKRLSPKTYQLLKTYFKNYHFSYKGMLIAIHYHYEVLGNPIVKEGVAILPYVYEEAQEYQKTKESVVAQISNVDLDKAVTNKVVKIKKRENTINDKLIDIAGLED